jgi:hypothetical protein
MHCGKSLAGDPRSASLRSAVILLPITTVLACT